MEHIFTVMPMSQNFSLKAGGTYTGEITIVNPIDATEDFNYKVSVAPYSVVGDDYSADLATMNNRTMISDWITIDEPTGSIKPNETRNVKFTITVPETAPAGGQYAAILASSDTSAASSDRVAVKNVFEIASLIYADVEGEIINEGEILSNDIPGFIVSTPATVSALLTNTGNVHMNAMVVIKVQNMFTGEVILPTEDEDGHYAEVIMPESKRLITRDITGLPQVGVVNISQTIYYNGEVSAIEQNVIICPIWFMATVAVAIGAIIAGIILLVKKNKRKKVVI